MQFENVTIFSCGVSSNDVLLLHVGGSDHSKACYVHDWRCLRWLFIPPHP